MKGGTPYNIHYAVLIIKTVIGATGDHMGQ